MNAKRTTSRFRASIRDASGHIRQRAPRQCELPTPDSMGRLRPRRVGQRGGLTITEQRGRSEADTTLREHHRPEHTGECPSGPCPWVSCRYHTALEVEFDGSLVVYRQGPYPGPKRGPKRNETLADSVAEEMVVRQSYETCALRMANEAVERGGMSVAEVARELDIDEKRVWQIEVMALRKLKRKAEAMGLGPDWLAELVRGERTEPDWGV